MTDLLKYDGTPRRSQFEKSQDDKRKVKRSIVGQTVGK